MRRVVGRRHRRRRSGSCRLGISGPSPRATGRCCTAGCGTGRGPLDPFDEREAIGPRRAVSQPLRDFEAATDMPVVMQLPVDVYLGLDAPEIPEAVSPVAVSAATAGPSGLECEV